MSDKYLYSPWRLDYILGEKPDECILCRCQTVGEDKENLVLWRGLHCFAMLNRYPYNNGHIMLVPNQHCSDLNDLASDTMTELTRLLQAGEAALREVYHCDGINVGINLGTAAGAGISEHLHIHMVPRWLGDNNFMSVVSGERVIPEAFEISWQKLRTCFAKMLPDKE